MSSNTMPDIYDEQINTEETESSMATQDEILMNESDILAGLLDLGKTKDVAPNYRKIQIKRSGVLKLEFRVRPLTEDESQTCMKRATKYAPTKPGQPKKVIETDRTKYRSYLIYAATVDEDRAKIWDNKKAMEAFGIFQSVDMIDIVLLAGEKDRVLDIIDEISGYNEDAGEIAGN